MNSRYTVIKLAFSPLQRAINWLVHGHITSNDEIKLFSAKCHEQVTLQTYDIKRETVQCYPRNVDRCYTRSECAVEGGLILLLESQGKQNSLFPSGPVIKC